MALGGGSGETLRALQEGEPLQGFSSSGFMCVSDNSFTFLQVGSLWLCLPRGKGHSGAVNTLLPQTTKVPCVFLYSSTSVLLKRFQFKCNLFLPGALQDLELCPGSGSKCYTSLMRLACSYV